MIKLHLILTPMTGVGLHNGFRGDDWYQYRVNIFKQYTLKSLQNQTNKNFAHWLTFRPEEQTNPITIDLLNYLKTIRYPFIATFDGLPYYDDKFSTDIVTRIMNFGRVLRDFWREKKITWKLLKECLNNKNKTLPIRLRKSLYKISDNLYTKDLEYVYVTRIDSDDMFHKETIQEIQAEKLNYNAFVCNKGLIYNKNTNELATWEPTTNPPFYTIVFKKDVFFNVSEHLSFMQGFKSHEDITTLYKTKTLKDNRYCVLVHDKHISTTWNHPFKGRSISRDKVNSVLKYFGI